MDASADNVRPGVPGQVSGDVTVTASTRRARIRTAAAARGVPLVTILTAVAVVSVTYLAAKLAYRLRDVIILIVVAGFLALILNPLVVYVQRHIRRRGWAVAIVTVWAALVFTGLLLAFPASPSAQRAGWRGWRSASGRASILRTWPGPGAG